MVKGSRKRDVDRLLDLQEQVEDSRRSIATLEGRRDAALDALKELGVESVAEAQIEIKKLAKQADKLEDQIDDTLAKIEAMTNE